MSRCPQCGRENGTDARFCMDCGAPLANEPPLAPRQDTYIGRVLENKYKVLEHLGDGGMGRVYKAEQLNLNKIVALKILHRNLLVNETQVQRFKREAWAASRLDHPNSIAITDIGTTSEGEHFIVMERLEGRELYQVIRDDFPLPPARVVKILTQVLSVLHAAHDAGILHRDLKPENIMLIERADEPDFVKVLDFGIAKPLTREPGQPALTMEGLVCGTPGYMSPEQGMGRTLDARSDIYAVGCILYQLLSQRVPGDDENPQAILMRHIQEPMVPPSKLRPELDIDQGLERIALCAMSKRPDARYPDALAMKRALLDLPLGKDVSPDWPAAGRTVVMGTGAPLREQTAGTSFTLPEMDASQPPAPSEVAESEPKRRTWAYVTGGVLVVLLAASEILALYGPDSAPTSEPAPLAKPEAPKPATAAPAPPAQSPQEAAKPVPIPAPAAAKAAAPAPAVEAVSREKLSPEARQAAAEEAFAAGTRALAAGESEKAIGLLRRAKQLDPDSAPVYKSLGMAYAQKGQVGLAKSHLETYLKLAPAAKDAARVRAVLEAL